MLFPMAFHVTGTPIVGLAEQIASHDEGTLDIYNRLHGIPLEVLDTLGTPEALVEYFSRESEAAMRMIGYSIDWRRKFTTTDPPYQKFIEWQFNLLHEMGHIVKGSHPVKWCLHDDNPVEDHDILTGGDATIVDYTLLKFSIDDLILPCATLRPETVFGVTNLWVNPDVIYDKVEVVSVKYANCGTDAGADDLDIADNVATITEIWVLSKEAHVKLTHGDKEKVTKVGEIAGRELIGKYVKNPVTLAECIILPASFVDPVMGTGVVMSVPAHAPYDYLAVRDLEGDDLSQYGISKLDIEPISLINVPNFGKFPAIEMVEELGVTSQLDKKAEEATKLVYRREFHNGILNETCGKYAGIAVSKIKDVLTRDLVESGKADVLYEFSQLPVICRCGAVCVVKMVKGQWFLNYSNPQWKEKVMHCIDNMQIIPADLKVEFKNKVDWLKDKACARRKGLGTLLPWDKEWLIESLGDSTIYMSYYVLSKFINKGIKPEQLKPPFFDFCLLGKGDVADVAQECDISIETLGHIRDDFKYWYPVDMRSSGKDLIPNHLLFFLFHHTAIFPEELWPKCIAINGFVSLEGKKMSKSTGPILTLKEAVDTYGADVTRLYILSAAEQTQDADWRDAGVRNATKQMARFIGLAQEAQGIETCSPSEYTMLDRWLISRLQTRILNVAEALDTLRTREALQHAFFLLINDIKWYVRRGGKNALPAVMNAWIRLLAPFTPHVCAEVWERLGNTGYLSLQSYPAADEGLIDKRAELSELIVEKTLSDIDEIVRVTGIAKSRVVLYASPAWKWDALRVAVKLNAECNLEMKSLMGNLMANPAMQAHKKEVPKFAQKLLGDVRDMSSDLADSIMSADLDELQVLNDAAEFLSREVGCDVVAYSGDNPEYDPQDKCRFAQPMRPAIYIE